MAAVATGEVEQAAAQLGCHGDERRLARPPIVEHGATRSELRR
jgi:hypothetical protein